MFVKQNMQLQISFEKDPETTQSAQSKYIEIVLDLRNIYVDLDRFGITIEVPIFTLAHKTLPIETVGSLYYNIYMAQKPMKYVSFKSP